MANRGLYTRTGELTPKQEHAALLRSQGKSWNEVAAETGFTAKGARNLPQLPAFDRRVQELTDAYIADALNLLKRHAVRAADVVIELMEPAADATLAESKANEVRLSAATDTLNRLGVSVEHDNPAPAVDLHVGIGIQVIDAAEQAFIAALRAQSALVGESLYTGEPPDSRRGAVPPLSLPSGVSARPGGGADGAEGAADGDEPDDGA